MSIQKEGQCVRVGASILTLMDKSTPVRIVQSLRKPLKRIIGDAQEWGLSGIQYVPMRWLTQAGRDVEAGRVPASQANKILSLEQSFRSERTLGEVRRHPNPLLAAQAMVLMQERRSCLQQLWRLHLDLDQGDLPTVMYPHLVEEPQYPRWDYFKKRLMQPTPALAQDVEGLEKVMKEQGFTGYALDTKHLRDGKGPLTDWQQSIDLLLPKTGLVHIQPASAAELNDLLDGTRHTAISFMLEKIAKGGYKGPYIIEADSAQFYAANAQRERIVDPERVVLGSLGLMAKTVRTIVS